MKFPDKPKLVVDSSNMGRIVIVEETIDSYKPAFELHYADVVDDEVPTFLRGRNAALAFANKLIALYNGAVEGGWH